MKNPEAKLDRLAGNIQDFFRSPFQDKQSIYFQQICLDQLCEFLSLDYQLFTSNYLDKKDDFTISLAQRILLILTSDASQLEIESKQRDRVNLLAGKKIDDIFRIESCSKQKEELFTFASEDGRKTFTFFVDWNTNRLFVKVKGKETDFQNRYADGYSVQTYCLAEYIDLEHISHLGKGQWSDIRQTEADSLANLIVCDRFDTKHIKGESIHPNNLDRLKYANIIESSLFRTYFPESVPGNTPHFHFYSEMISLSLTNNNASLSMTPLHLAKYLQDLAIATKSNTASNGILTYPMCMPYLDIALGNLVYENENFLESAKSLLVKYQNSGNSPRKNGNITDLFSALDKLVPPDGTATPIEKAATDATILATVIDLLPPEAQVELVESFTDGYEKPRPRTIGMAGLSGNTPNDNSNTNGVSI